jgi:acetyl esterase/lipase
MDGEAKHGRVLNALADRLTKPIDPRRYRRTSRAGDGPVVVCAGDSITHGVMSANYVAMLDERLRPAGYRVVNAGVSGDLAYNLEERLDDIVACDPDVVTILVGTNDVAAHIDESWRDGYMKQKRLPQYPTVDWYGEMLEQIVRRLRSETHARLAILDLPPLGEDLDSSHNERVGRFNERIRQVARATNAPVLPLHDRLVAALPSGHRPPPFDGSKRLMGTALVQRLVLRRTYDRIADGHGLTLLIDNVHLDDRAASIVTDLIEDFVAGESRVSVRDVEVPTSDGSIRARLYRSARSTTGRGVGFLWLHGGGFVAGSIDMAEGDAVARAMAASGATVLSVDYRRVPPLRRLARWHGAPAVRFPTPVHDCLDAWRWLARELGPTTPIVVGGASAGGDLAVLSALRATVADLAPAAAVILAYPLLHPSLSKLPGGLQHRLAEPAVRWMAGCFVGPGEVTDGFPLPDLLDGFPQTTIVVAERDPLRLSAEAFAADLRARGVDVELAVEPGTRHGYLNHPTRPTFARTIERFAVRTASVR